MASANPQPELSAYQVAATSIIYYGGAMSDADKLQLTHSILAQFGHPLVSYISGSDIGPEWPTSPIPPNVRVVIDKLSELRDAIVSSGQPLSPHITRFAILGHFDSMREEMGGELSELISGDPIIQSLSVILRGLSTLAMTAPYVYAYEPLASAVHEVGIWDPELESSFRMRVAGDDALLTFYPKK